MPLPNLVPAIDGEFTKGLPLTDVFPPIPISHNPPNHGNTGS